MDKAFDLDQCYLIDFPRFDDDRGSLVFIEGSNHIPFDISRIYYLYGVPDSSTRGSHAHKELSQIIFAVSGSFDIVVNDGQRSERITLSSPDKGIYICPMIWRDLDNFSEDAVCMVLASDIYSSDDYIYTFNDFISEKKQS